MRYSAIVAQFSRIIVLVSFGSGDQGIVVLFLWDFARAMVSSNIW